MRAISTCFLILALQPALLFPFQSSPPQQKDAAFELWRVRSQTITDDLLKDASQLAPLRRALLSVKLAQTWWRDDPKRAQSWISNAVEILEKVPNKENADERRQRLALTQRLVPIVMTLDQKLGKRLIAVLTDFDESATSAERDNAADGLIRAAVAMTAQDPKRAAELGRMALRFGRPREIDSLIFELRRRDANLSNSLLAEALTIARQNLLDVNWLDSLTYVTFPAQKGLGDKIPGAPDNLRIELLQLLVAFLNTDTSPVSNRTAMCFSAGSFVAPVLAEFDRLLPQQAPAVRQIINKCGSLIQLNQPQIGESADNRNPTTIEELLKAGEEEKDLNIRTHYQYRAAALAKNLKDYDQAIGIIDNMNKESREAMGVTWDAIRWEWAVAAALDHYQQGRLPEMNRVLNAVPANLQPTAKTAFVDRLPERRDPDTDPALQFIGDVRSGLQRSNIPDSEKYGCYLVLLRSIVKYDPAATGSVFKEAIAALNRAEKSEESEIKKLDTGYFEKMLPASILEMDEFAVREGLASVNSLETRAQLRLVLLAAVLEEMKTAHAGTGTATPQP